MKDEKQQVPKQPPPTDKPAKREKKGFDPDLRKAILFATRRSEQDGDYRQTQRLAAAGK